ncbi:hypothetical protein ACFL52_01605 [Candidatus Margulisiibacteriota bacterium]
MTLIGPLRLPRKIYSPFRNSSAGSSGKEDFSPAQLLAIKPFLFKIEDGDLIITAVAIKYVLNMPLELGNWNFARIGTLLRRNEIKKGLADLSEKSKKFWGCIESKILNAREDIAAEANKSELEDNVESIQEYIEKDFLPEANPNLSARERFFVAHEALIKPSDEEINEITVQRLDKDVQLIKDALSELKFKLVK